MIHKRLFILFFFFLLFFGGCSSPIFKKEIKPQTRTLSIISDDLKSPIKDRITYLKDLIDSNKLSHEDKGLALNLIDTYQNILDTKKLNKDIFQLILKNLISTDTFYFSHSTKKRILFEVFNKKQKIINLYLSGDFKGVIEGSNEFEEEFGFIPYDIAIIVAESYAKQGEINHAISIGEKVANEMTPIQGRVHLYQKLAEWFIRAKNKKKAVLYLNKMKDEIDELNSIDEELRLSLKGKSRRPIILQEHEMPREIGDHMDSILKRVGQLIKDGAYDEAKMLLIEERKNIKTEEEKRIIDDAIESIEIEKQKSIKGPSPLETSSKDSIQIANNLIKNKRYEEAIDILNLMNKNTELENERIRLKNIAVEKLINRERNRAAKLFLLAEREKQTKRKLNLLKQAGMILRTLIEKYPESGLIPRVKNNLKRVEEEIEKINNSPPPR